MQLIKNNKFQKGVLSVEFLFTFSFMCLLIIYFIMVAITFNFVEISQYIAFQTSRAYFVGNENVASQEGVAQSKFDSLYDSFIRPNTGGENPWVELSSEIGAYIPEDPNPSPYNLFLGARLTLKSKVLGMNIPYLLEGMGPLDFEIASYLGREPSKQECESFMAKKWDWIRSQYQSNNLGPVHVNTSDLSKQGNGC